MWFFFHHIYMYWLHRRRKNSLLDHAFWLLGKDLKPYFSEQAHAFVAKEPASPVDSPGFYRQDLISCLFIMLWTAKSSVARGPTTLLFKMQYSLVYSVLQYSVGQTCTNTRNTSIPPGVLSFLSWICRQIQTDGRHVFVVNLAISNPASATLWWAGFIIQ